MAMTVTFRGTGDAMGVPRVYCGCEVCAEARTGGVNRRLRSAVELEGPDIGLTYIDCGPDWGRQMEAGGLRDIDRIFITHPHFDHIGGLIEWSDACRWLDKRGEAYAPPEVVAGVKERFPWLDRWIDFRPLEAPVRFGPWEVSAWRVNHGRNGYAYAYRFDNRETGSAWAYCSDSIDLTPREKEPMRGVSLLVLGTSFYEEPFPMETRSVYDVTEAIALREELGVERLICTHMSHDIDRRHDYGLPDGVSFAVEGQTLRLR